MDKLRAGALDLVFEILWTALSIATVLLLWNNIVSRVPTGWTEGMVLAFALFLEIYYIIRSYIRDIIWMVEEFYVEGYVEPFLKPHPYLYEILRKNDGGYILASLLKLPILLIALVALYPGWWKGFIVFSLAMILYTGFELFVVGLSLLFMESGSLWNLLYSFLGYLVEIPADFYRGLSRFFVTVLTPVFFVATFPAKVVFGFLDQLTLLLIITPLWLLLGYGLMKTALKRVQAYGG